MWANNETGVIFPVEKIAAMAKEKGAIFHTDSVQAVGKLPINLKESQIDMLSLSGHKLHAPKGVGVLYVRKGTPFVPFMIGGHQEHGRRAGTENVPYIIGLGKAAELAMGRLEDENTRVKAMRDKLTTELLKVDATRLNGDFENRLPNTASISFEFVEGESILLLALGPGHLRQLRLGLHLGLPGAQPCAKGNGHPLHRGPRLHPVLAQLLQHHG
jgi:cysteine desulfurase